MSIEYNHAFLPRRNFRKDNSSNLFSIKAIVGSFLLHLLLFFLKFPNEQLIVHPKEKLSALKMQFITPPESYRLKKNNVSKLEKGGDQSQGPTSQVQKSKAGSPKKGPLSSPQSVSRALGDSSQKGYEFKGNGLKALMGNSSSVSLAVGINSEGSAHTKGAQGSNRIGNNLTGDDRAPSGVGDGTGHLLGKDSFGNYDRSSSTKGLSQKKGIDTAFVQPDTVVMGAIDPELLRKILSEYLAQFKFCYQQELQEQSEKIKGIVDLNFRIEGDGKVSKISIKSAQTQFSDKAIGCMSNVLRMIDFPHPKGGGLVDIRQPLNFYSESTKI